jgi:hypothetical protein
MLGLLGETYRRIGVWAFAKRHQLRREAPVNKFLTRFGPQSKRGKSARLGLKTLPECPNPRSPFREETSTAPLMLDGHGRDGHVGCPLLPCPP